MVLHCRREIANRHCIFWFKKLKNNQKMIQNDSKIDYNTKFYNYLAKVLNNKFVKFLTLIIYLTYLMVSIKWILQLPLGKKFCGKFYVKNFKFNKFFVKNF